MHLVAELGRRHWFVHLVVSSYASVVAISPQLKCYMPELDSSADRDWALVLGFGCKLSSVLKYGLALLAPQSPYNLRQSLIFLITGSVTELLSACYKHEMVTNDASLRSSVCCGQSFSRFPYFAAVNVLSK